MSIGQEIIESFKKGNVLTRFIYLNISVFLIFALIHLIEYLLLGNTDSTWSNYFSVPSNLSVLVSQPWSPLTYMFLHTNFLHILFNMLWLYWFGKIFLERLSSSNFVSVYILGGLVGALFYILAFNSFSVFQPMALNSYALGASASVMAIVFAITFLIPEYKVYLVFLGEVKLKYIALFSIVLDLISIPVGNAGGHIAHLGGALFGFVFIYYYKKGILITKWLETAWEKLIDSTQSKPKMKVTYRKTGHSDIDYNTRKVSDQAKVDAILDRISRSGYASLSKEEKEFLFKSGQK
jgi:membrane associated rhomboid family serine protease